MFSWPMTTALEREGHTPKHLPFITRSIIQSILDKEAIINLLWPQVWSFHEDHVSCFHKVNYIEYSI